ncbi:MAG: UDP-2,3-diacylglucosamine diphosphatase [Alistipes sp.]|nr:UDP-2,3-diacylglucosamine diphosphatase [Alistipes sp.]
MHYFASDIHLGVGSAEEVRATEQRFVAWLDRVAEDAETVVLAGDIFDFWFEYREVVPQGFVRTLGKLAELTDRGIRVLFFTGNHDMWVGNYLSRECGVEIYTKPTSITLEGRTIFIAHGDNMNIDGQWVLKAMNTMFRSRTLRWCFSWLIHPDWAMRFGHWWSGHSRKQHATQTTLTESVTAPLIEYARTHARTHEGAIDAYLFGHMHYARDYREEKLHVVLLGAWDHDPTFAVLDKAGNLELKHLDL